MQILSHSRLHKKKVLREKDVEKTDFIGADWYIGLPILSANIGR